MPSKRRLLPQDANIPYLPADRLKFIRDLASKTAEAAGTPSEFSRLIQAANGSLGKCERGYFAAWVDAHRLYQVSRP